MTDSVFFIGCFLFPTWRSTQCISTDPVHSQAFAVWRSRAPVTQGKLSPPLLRRTDVDKDQRSHEMTFGEGSARSGFQIFLEGDGAVLIAELD
jgi:hypothetical protein